MAFDVFLEYNELYATIVQRFTSNWPKSTYACLRQSIFGSLAVNQSSNFHAKV